MRRSLYIHADATRHRVIACKHIFKINVFAQIELSNDTLGLLIAGTSVSYIRMELESGVRQWQPSFFRYFVGIVRQSRARIRNAYAREHADTIKENKKRKNTKKNTKKK